MNALIKPHDMPLTMTSREIAELTGKVHSNVMRDIRAMMDALVQDSNLNSVCKTTTYSGTNGQSYDQYELDKDTCLTLLLGYDAVARMKVVKRWQELERMVDQPKVPQSMPEALRLAAEAIEQRDQLALENKAQAEALAEAQPKVAGFDLIAAGEKSITIRESAKLLGVKENRLTTWLHEHGWTYRLNGRWVAKQEHIQGGRLIYKEAKYTDEKTGHEVYAPYCHITPKGLSKLARVFGSGQAELAA